MVRIIFRNSANTCDVRVRKVLPMCMNAKLVIGSKKTGSDPLAPYLHVYLAQKYVHVFKASFCADYLGNFTDGPARSSQWQEMAPRTFHEKKKGHVFFWVRWSKFNEDCRCREKNGLRRVLYSHDLVQGPLEIIT